MLFSCAAPIMPVVSAVFGMWIVTKSLVASSSSSVTRVDAELLRAGRRHVGVVGDDVDAEGLQAGGDEGADAAESDDADALLVQFDAGVLRAFPLARGEGGVGGGDVPGEAQDVADREFGGADDVGCRRVDDHHAGFGRGLDVDVVEPDPGAGDDLQARERRRSLRRRSASPTARAPRGRRRAPPAGRPGRCRRCCGCRSPGREPRPSRERVLRRSRRSAWPPVDSMRCDDGLDDPRDSAGHTARGRGGRPGSPHLCVARDGRPPRGVAESITRSPAGTQPRTP